MRRSTLIIFFLSFIVTVVLLGGCTSYNGMVKSEEAVDKAWANVQASYQRRFDLIPSLVSTVKGYAEHEKSTFQSVTNARAGLITQGDSLVAMQKGLETFTPDGNGPSLSQIEELAGKMSLYINAVHEAYPNLKANENFKDLQEQIESTENRINTERNNYNEAVQIYNVRIRKFPGNIFAGLFGFDRKNPFSAAADAQTAPTVTF